MRILYRLAKITKREIHRRRRQFIIDTIATTIFWLIIHGLKDVFIVRLTMYQVLLAGGTGAVLNLLFGGIQGQLMNYLRRLVHAERK